MFSSDAFISSENGDSSAVRQFAWIPNEILHISNLTSEAKAAAEQVIADYVLPLPSSSTISASTSKNVEVDEVAWTERLLNIMQHLDDLGINAILSMSGIKAKCVDRFSHRGQPRSTSCIVARPCMNIICKHAYRTT